MNNDEKLEGGIKQFVSVLSQRPGLESIKLKNWSHREASIQINLLFISHNLKKEIRLNFDDSTYFLSFIHFNDHRNLFDSLNTPSIIVNDMSELLNEAISNKTI